MSIRRVIVKNYRALKDTDINLLENLNIIVGDNETGKSTLLEAINLALKCQLNRRAAAYELHPFLFNTEIVSEFISKHRNGENVPPPEICIELFLADEARYAELKGTNNSASENAPGVGLYIRFDEERFAEEYKEYVSDPDSLNSIPIEFYEIVWQTFAGDPVSYRKAPIKSALVDPSSISNTYSANKYVLEIIRDYLNKKQQVGLALSYRKMKDLFLDDESVKGINEELAGKAGEISEKTISVSMDTTTRASWETGVLPHLDDIPLPLVGKGEQNSIKIKLALAAAEACEVFLMEEPENHLSHTNLNRLIGHIADKSEGKQIILTTHSSFVLNKLGVENIQMFNGETGISLTDLPTGTKSYFKKLPGHDTLRMILASRAILVEGPSDELIVQKAFFQQFGHSPLESGVEVISVGSLAFKRFLDIAKLLKLDVRVVTDNDAKLDRLKAKYVDYEGEDTIRICYSEDETLPTLEPHLLAVNGRDALNAILGRNDPTDEALLSYMDSNKAHCALKVFESTEEIQIPEYIQNAIQ